ncbi:crossover junction endonuclease MUS81-like isoform X2 [Penaeus japonicus]|uniref:crossover junction endonuclease MUS81-like isoform X2 n=1 Tax=Penaeus japonicus TaxID=27405 RepID=UPI001C70EB3F|nr:crossover junction endonuclease MUS81-like isoform X2 [Penaeus japonicus]
MSGKGRTPIKKKYRRTKRTYKHPNPLFEKWLKEWQDEAARRHSNMKYNFQRARKSLKLFPLPLYSGKDCKVLAHFGDKICQLIDQQLEEYQQENGPINWDEVHQIQEETQTKKRGRPRKNSTDGNLDLNNETESSPSGNSASLEVQQKKGKSPGGRKGRAYIPAPRSGAYGLLMALYNASKDDDYPGYLGKKELIEAATPLCDVSFTHSAEGSHYTAWSSMGTLIKKELVRKESSPGRYFLTSEGKALGAKISQVEGGFVISSPSKSPQPAASSEEVIVLSSRSCSPVIQGEDFTNEDFQSFKGVCDTVTTEYGGTASKDPETEVAVPVKRKRPDIDSKRATKISRSVTSPVKDNISEDDHLNPPENFVFSYITSLEMETPMRQRAVVSVEEDGFLGYLIKCRHAALPASGLVYRLDNHRIAPPGYVYAYLSSECAPIMSPGLLSPSRPKSTTKRPLPSVQVPKVPFGTHFSENAEKKSSDVKKQATGTTATGLSKEPNQVTAVTTKNLYPPLSERQNTIESYIPKTNQVARDPLFSLFPGQFDIVLCVDNCEITGGFTGGKSNTREIIITELDKHGIKYDVRKLHVGDFLWVCQERIPLNGERRELVLPYIVERKRMDDLASSIRDGRFREQKFRLKQSGLSRPIYLVEEYGSKHMSLPETTCLQAVVNTHVVDEFTVKITKDQRESAAYLTIMTRCLQSLYQGKLLKAMAREHLKEGLETSVSMDEIETTLMTFSEFNSSSVKNRQLQVREMFAKHLLQIHGVSVDKARAVVDKYGTPKQLMEAYKNITSSEVGENMLASLKCGKAGRNLGTVLSATIYKMYSNKSLH